MMCPTRKLLKGGSEMKKKVALYILIMALISGGTSQAAVTIYATRAGFDFDYPGLPIEDFEAAAEEMMVLEEPYPHVYRMEEDEVLDEYTDNAAFHPGDILPGIQIACKWAGNKLVVLGVGAEHFGIYPSSVIISNISDEQSLNINFPDGVNAVAFDVFHGGDNVGISVYGEDDTLLYDETEITSGFFGVHSTELIHRINVDAPYGGDGHFEAIDNIAFGLIEPTPEEKLAGILDYFADAVAADAINGRSRGRRGRLQVLSVYWNLRFAELFLNEGLDRLACLYLRIAQRRSNLWLVGDAVADLIEQIESLRDDLGCRVF